MKSVRFIDVSFDKKDNQIISEKSDKIKIKEYLKSENNYFNEDLFFPTKTSKKSFSFFSFSF